MAGADTPTAAMGQSVREVAETLADRDPRIAVEGEPGPSRLAELLAGHHVLVAPDRLGVDPAPALRALAVGLPLLATPVGELAELVEPGANGWLCDGLGTAPLRAALEHLLADPAAALDALEPSSSSAARAGARVDGEAVLDAYDALLAPRELRHAPAAAHPAEPPLVSVVVPYFAAHEHVEEAVASALAQTHPELEVLIVDDGSFAAEDVVLEKLAEEPRVCVLSRVNGGESTARNFGAAMAHGEYLVLLDADNVLEPSFVTRALAAFARDPGLAYVACWQRVIGPRGEPVSEPLGSAQLGNRVLAGNDANFDADTMAMVRRELFVEEDEGFDPEGAMHSDWELFRRLRRDGRFGVVVPARLGRYRALPGSLMRGFDAELQEVAWAQSLDRIELSRTRWTAAAGG